VRQYLAVLDRQAWCDTVRPGLDRDTDFTAWFTDTVAERLHLRTFADSIGGDR
jgi:hypothetical protein